jgi:penicillin-binding protein-related factor A (putative recombinase)
MLRHRSSCWGIFIPLVTKECTLNKGRMPLMTFNPLQLAIMQTYAPDEPRIRFVFYVRAEKLE